ncbi:SpoIIE family protein phosphatase [Streptomyces lydicus]|uniref:SpoIIE family protein phosphatase n=1 Tax=Streptomyces lydicus TaxID=47763 RepID=UPI0036E17051
MKSIQQLPGEVKPVMSISRSPDPHPTAKLLSCAAQAALASLDARGAITGWTEGAHHLTGYTADEVMHRPAASLLTVPAENGQPADVIERFRAGESWQGELAVRHRAGHDLHLTVHIAPMVGGDDRMRWIALVLDQWQTPFSELGAPMLAPLLAHSPIGVAVLGPDLRFIWVNEALTYGGSVPLERRLGQRLGELFPHMEVDVLEGAMRQVLETGQPVLNFEYFGRSPVDPERRHAWWMCFFRLEDAAGHVLGVWYMVMDITERWRARERSALLNKASARIGSTLEVTVTTQELADVAVPGFADHTAVDLLESVMLGSELVPGAPHSITLRRTGQRSVLAKNQTAPGRPGETVSDPSPSAVRCLMSGRSVAESSSDDSAPHSSLFVPVKARGVTLGVAHFARSQRPEPFDQEDVNLAEELASRAGVCVDNARRFTRERTASLTLQRTLLPRALAGGTALDVAWRYLPAGASSGVGGDWFDVIPLSGARVAMVVGDVVGHGTNAAATMGRLRAAVRTLAGLDLPPDEVLAHLDDLVISLIEQEGASEAGKEEPDTAICVLGSTCLYAVYDPVSQRCAMARAGHPPPVVMRPGETAACPDLPAGPPLGLGGLPFESAEFDLPEGSLLAFYTDGLIENGNQDVEAALSCLGEVLAQPGATLEGICEDTIRRLLTEPQSDDIALIVSRTRALGKDQVASWNLATDPAVVSRARAFATRQLSDWGLDDLSSTTELIVSELVTNAIRYGSGPIHLRLIRQNSLICEVSDASNTSPRLRHARTTDEGGRGLFLVAQLARGWGTRYTTGGKTIWAEQSISSATGAALLGAISSELNPDAGDAGGFSRPVRRMPQSPA